MSIYLEIAGRIRSEILQLDVIVKKASVSWQLAAKHSDKEQENTDPHLFDDLIGAIDVREDGSVSHDHYNWDL